MKGLIKKDFYIAKAILPVLMLMAIIMGTALYFITNSFVFIPILSSTLSSLTISSVTNDKHSKWDKIEFTLPLKIETVYLEKYIFHFALVISGIIIGSVISLIIAFATNTFMLSQFISNLSIAAVLGFVSGAIIIPFTYRLSAEVSIVVAMLSYLVSVGFIFVFKVLLIAILPNNCGELAYSVLIMVASILLFLFSYLLSKKSRLKESLGK